MKCKEIVFNILGFLVLILIAEFYAKPVISAWENESLRYYFSVWWCVLRDCAFLMILFMMGVLLIRGIKQIFGVVSKDKEVGGLELGEKGGHTLQSGKTR